MAKYDEKIELKDMLHRKADKVLALEVEIRQLKDQVNGLEYSLNLIKAVVDPVVRYR